VDTWKVTHNKEGNLIETFVGKTQMEEVQNIRYLCVIISCDGKNSKKIIHKQNRALGIQKSIMSMVNGLGKYTVECGFIYLNSIYEEAFYMLQKLMIDIKEEDFRKIEQIEEDLMRKLLSTDRSCPLHLMYLEVGQVPSRFIIKRMILCFLQIYNATKKKIQ
jgi:hypothetical protein